MVEMQDRDDVDYLELMVFDSNGRIFRNLRRKFLTKNSYFSLWSQTVKMNLQKPFL